MRESKTTRNVADLAADNDNRVYRSGYLVRSERVHAGGRPRSPVKAIDPTIDVKPLRVDGAGKVFGQRPIPEHVRKKFGKLIPECVEKLTDLMYNAESEKVQLDAALAIISYGYGKPETVARVQMEMDNDKELQIARIVRAHLLNHMAENTIDFEDDDQEASADK